MEGWILTGVSRGIGRALLDALLERPGARVVGVARHAPQALPADTAARFTFIEADLARADQTGQVIGRALAALGEIRQLTLINNAGVATPMTLAGHYPADAVARALAVNLQAPILLSNDLLRLAPPDLALNILNITSGAAVNIYPGWGIYGASKAGLDHFTRHLSIEAAGRARVCALAPGVVDTAMQADIRASAGTDFPNRARFDDLKRAGALSAPADTARRILAHLASPGFGDEPVLDLRNLFPH